VHEITTLTDCACRCLQSVRIFQCDTCSLTKNRVKRQKFNVVSSHFWKKIFSRSLQSAKRNGGGGEQNISNNENCFLKCVFVGRRFSRLNRTFEKAAPHYFPWKSGELGLVYINGGAARALGSSNLCTGSHANSFRAGGRFGTK